MRLKNILFICTCLLAKNSAGQQPAKVVVDSAALLGTASDDNQMRGVRITYHDPSRKQEHSFLASSVADSITLFFVRGDDIVLLGEAGRAQSVEILSSSSRKVVDRFLCYSPRKVFGNLLVYVEFYQTLASGHARDVLLAYDLDRSPYENRLAHADPVVSTRGDEAVRVGYPIYPSGNAQSKSYDNVFEQASEIDDAIVGSRVAELSGRRIALGTIKSPGGAQRSVELAVCDLSRGLDHAISKTYVLPQGDQVLELIAIQELTPSKLKLIVRNESGGTAELTLNL